MTDGKDDFAASSGSRDRTDQLGLARRDSISAPPCVGVLYNRVRGVFDRSRLRRHCDANSREVGRRHSIMSVNANDNINGVQRTTKY